MAPGKLKEKCSDFDCLKNLEFFSAKDPSSQASSKAEWYKYAETLEKEYPADDLNNRAGTA